MNVDHPQGTDNDNRRTIMNEFFKFRSFKILNTTTLTAIYKGECKQLFNTKELKCPAGIYVKEVFLIMNYQNVDTGPKMIAVQAEIEHILANHGTCGLDFQRNFFVQFPDYSAHEKHSIGKVC